MSEALSVHAQVVRGIVRAVLYKGTHTNPTFGEAYSAALPVGEKVDDIAEESITEFVKDLVWRFPERHVAAVVAGDYASVWVLTNSWLKETYSLDPVEPVTITP